MKKNLIIGTSTCLLGLIIGWVFKLWMAGHEKMHPALPPRSFYSFTLTESDARIPCLQAEVEGIPFLAELDLGYEGVLSLPKPLLDQLTHKYDEKMVLLGNIKGKKYETSVFTIPRLYIGNLALANFPAEESTLEFERDSNLGTQKNTGSSDVRARIGWEAFLGTVLLIDLNKSIAICCDSVESLKEKGYRIEQFVSINFLPNEHLLEFKTNIDNREVKCLLDTGCTLNLLHSLSTEEESEICKVDFDNPLPSTTLNVDGYCLGSCVFYETQLPFGIEAILGIDFLETQIVCIDFINRKLLLSPIPEENYLDSEIVRDTSAAL